MPIKAVFTLVEMGNVHAMGVYAPNTSQSSIPPTGSIGIQPVLELVAPE